MSDKSDDTASDVSASLPKRVATALFEGEFGSLQAHTERKGAVADPLRYAVLYTVWKHDGATRAELLSQAAADDDLVEAALVRLVDAELLACRPGPDGIGDPQALYQVTPCGRGEIEGDRATILDAVE